MLQPASSSLSFQVGRFQDAVIANRRTRRALPAGSHPRQLAGEDPHVSKSKVILAEVEAAVGTETQKWLSRNGAVQAPLSL